MSRILFPDRSNHQQPKPAKPKRGLRRVSKRRAKLNRKVNPERKAFVEAFGVCMACYRRRKLDCHEICRGPAREAAIQQPKLWLALCRDCHEGNAGNWPIAKQLALRLSWDIPGLVDLANTLRGRGPNAVTVDEVMEELECLI